MGIEHALVGDGVKELQDDLIEQTINPKEVYLSKLLQKVYNLGPCPTRYIWINKNN